MCRAFPLLLAAVFLTAGHVGAESGAGLRQVGVIPLSGVEGRIDHMAFDGQSGRLYVAALGNNTVEVVDVGQGKVVHTIRGLANPQGIGVDGKDRRVFVANAKDGSCRIFDANSFGQVGSVDLKDDADNVRYDVAAGRMYVGYGDGALAVLEAGSGKHLLDIKLPAHPESFQLESKGRRVFVNLPDAGGVVGVVDRDKGKLVQTWPVGEAKANFPMALDEANHRLFVGCRQPARLVVMDTETGKAAAALECVGDTDDVWYDAGAGRVYVSGGAGAVSVFSRGEGGRYTVAGSVATASGARTSFFAPELGTLFVAVPHRGGQKAEIRVFKSEGAK